MVGSLTVRRLPVKEEKRVRLSSLQPICLYRTMVSPVGSHPTNSGSIPLIGTKSSYTVKEAEQPVKLLAYPSLSAILRDDTLSLVTQTIIVK